MAQRVRKVPPGKKVSLSFLLPTEVSDRRPPTNFLPGPPSAANREAARSGPRRTDRAAGGRRWDSEPLAGKRVKTPGPQRCQRDSSTARQRFNSTVKNKIVIWKIQR